MRTGMVSVMPKEVRLQEAVLKGARSARRARQAQLRQRAVLQSRRWRVVCEPRTVARCPGGVFTQEACITGMRQRAWQVQAYSAAA